MPSPLSFCPFHVEKFYSKIFSNSNIFQGGSKTDAHKSYWSLLNFGKFWRNLKMSNIAVYLLHI